MEFLSPEKLFFYGRLPILKKDSSRQTIRNKIAGNKKIF